MEYFEKAEYALLSVFGSGMYEHGQSDIHPDGDRMNTNRTGCSKQPRAVDAVDNSS